MRKTATFKAVSANQTLWRCVSLQQQAGDDMNVLVAQEPPDKLYSLRELREDFDAVRQHWRFEHGLLHVGTADEIYEIIGVPHCGNRFVQNLLIGSGVHAQIAHMARGSYPAIAPVRDPRAVLLSHWKRIQGPLTDGYIDAFCNKWDLFDVVQAERDAVIFHVDREPVQDFLDRMGLPGKGDVSKEGHHIRDDLVMLKQVTPRLKAIAKRWGYPCL